MPNSLYCAELMYDLLAELTPLDPVTDPYDFDDAFRDYLVIQIATLASPTFRPAG